MTNVALFLVLALTYLAVVVVRRLTRRPLCDLGPRWARRWKK